MRLGGPIFGAFDSPATWVERVQEAGYRAAYCPVPTTADAATIAAYRAAAAAADIVIAEVGAWSNPLSPDEATRAAAVAGCQASLRLADAIGARCCVNIVGSRGARWDGPSALDLADDAVDCIVASVREIVDSVAPTRTFYTLETMPWMHPHSVESYEALLAAIDRECVAVHFDPVNLINSPTRYFANADVVRHFVERLGPRIRSVHCKDIALADDLTVHLSEARPGTGGMDYPALLATLTDLDPDLPVMLEHLPNETEYTAAAEHLRSVARKGGWTL